MNGWLIASPRNYHPLAYWLGRLVAQAIIRTDVAAFMQRISVSEWTNRLVTPPARVIDEPDTTNRTDTPGAVDRTDE